MEIPNLRRKGPPQEPAPPTWSQVEELHDKGEGRGARSEGDADQASDHERAAAAAGTTWCVRASYILVHTHDQEVWDVCRYSMYIPTVSKHVHYYS